MQERLRQHYLKALGIESYVPRVLLAGAAPSVLLEADEVESGLVLGDVRENVYDTPSLSSAQQPVASAPEIAAADSPQSANSAQRAGDLAAELLVEKRQPRAAGSESQAAKGLSSDHGYGEAAERISFNLNVWRINADLLVVDSHELQQALPTGKLLRNILFALGIPLSSLPKPEILRWPLGSRPNNNAAEAAAMVQAYLAAQLEKEFCPWVLLMGEAALRFALPGGFDKSIAESIGERHSFGAVANEQDQSKALVLPSLGDLLRQPALKAQSWQALKALGRQSKA